MNYISYIIDGGQFLLLADPAGIGKNPSNWSLLNMIGQFFFLIAIFALIIFMAVFSLRFAGRFKNYQGGNNNLRIIESRSLGAQNFIHLIKTGNKYIVVGTSKENIALITELDKESVTDIFETGVTEPFGSHLSEQMKKHFRTGKTPEE